VPFTDLAAPIGRPVGDTNGKILDLTQPGCGLPGLGWTPGIGRHARSVPGPCLGLGSLDHPGV